MIQALYAAASGMQAVEEQQGVLANNLANASTPGFKRQSATTEGFYQVLMNKMVNPSFLDAQEKPGGGIQLDRTYTDFKNGPVATTGQSLNIALMGPGFLHVQTPDGERYTRDGRFSINADGFLSTLDGHPVLGPNATPIRVDEGPIDFDEDGNVLVNGQPASRLEIIEFDNTAGLSREGSNLYTASPGALAQSRPAEETEVVDKSLEMSNVQLPYEMAQMMVGLRAYGAYQKVISSADESVGRLIDQVAMPL